MKKTFEIFLQEKHSEENPQIIDDNLPGSFEGWLEQLSTNELIEYANEYTKSQREDFGREIFDSKKGSKIRIPMVNGKEQVWELKEIIDL